MESQQIAECLKSMRGKFQRTVERMEWPSTKFGKIVKGTSLWQKSRNSSPSFFSSAFQIYFRFAFLLSPPPLINYLSFFFLDLFHSLLNGLSVSFLSPYYELLSRKWIQSCKNVNASNHCIKSSQWFLVKLKCIPVYNISLISLLTNLFCSGLFSVPHG